MGGLQRHAVCQIFVFVFVFPFFFWACALLLLLPGSTDTPLLPHVVTVVTSSCMMHLLFKTIQGMNSSCEHGTGDDLLDHLLDDLTIALPLVVQ